MVRAQHFGKHPRRWCNRAHHQREPSRLNWPHRQRFLRRPAESFTRPIDVDATPQLTSGCRSTSRLRLNGFAETTILRDVGSRRRKRKTTTGALNNIHDDQEERLLDYLEIEQFGGSDSCSNINID